MFELASALFSIADANEFRFARFYIVCEEVVLAPLGKSAHCLRVVGHILRIVKAWQETQNLMHRRGMEEILEFCFKDLPPPVTFWNFTPAGSL